MDKYKVENINLSSDSENVIQLWSANFNRNFDYHHKYNWLYKNNPNGESDLFLLHFSESAKCVGVQGVSTRLMEYNGEQIKAGLVADFAVNQDHRSLGPGLFLLKSVIQSCKLNKYDLIYSFPNKKAIPVFKRAGYESSFEISRYSKVIRTYPYFVKKLPKIFTYILPFIADNIIYTIDLFRYIKISNNIKIDNSVKIDKRFDILWANASFKNDVILTKRGSDYINWRIKENIDNQNIFVIKNKSGDICGYIIYLIKDSICHIIDFMAIDSDDYLKYLFTAFIFKIRNKKTASISLEFRGPKNIEDAITSIGFTKRESRSLFCVDNNNINLSQKNWFLTSWDEDAI